MAYTTRTRILAEIPESELIRLTDDGNEGAVDYDVVDDQMDKATDTVNAYIPGDCGLAVPLASPPNFIMNACDVLVRVGLMGRKRVPTDETTKSRYDQVMDMLKRLSEGKIKLQSSGPVQSSETPSGEADSEGRVMTRDELDGM